MGKCIYWRDGDGWRLMEEYEGVEDMLWFRCLVVGLLLMVG